MKLKTNRRRCGAVLLLLVMLLAALTGCRRQVVEKVGVLPDRPTQLTTHTTDEENEALSKSWDVQHIDDLMLSSTDAILSKSPSAHYFNGAIYLYRAAVQDENMTLYSIEKIHPDTSLEVIHSLAVPADTTCYFSPDGSRAAYGAWADGCLTLRLVDLTSGLEQVVWQSEDASILKELGFTARLVCQWSPDGFDLLFMPLCYIDSSASSSADDAKTNESTAPPSNDETQAAGSDVGEAAEAAEAAEPDTAMEDSSSEGEPLDGNAEGSQLADDPEAASDTLVIDDTTAVDDTGSDSETAAETATQGVESDFKKESGKIDRQALALLSPNEKLQIAYEALASFPFIYTYQLPQQSLQSFLISSEDYPLYEMGREPMICASQDGARFFVYFNDPSNPSLAHYVDVSNTIHYSTPLSDYLPSFTQLGSAPVFYHDLLYLHVNGIGIMALDPYHGKQQEFYSFNDPIHSFTVYDDTLIVAQPSSTGISVDVTAYHLINKQSVLLYHSETYNSFINHIEMNQDGMQLLIEELISGSRPQKRLIQLAFQ